MDSVHKSVLLHESIDGLDIHPEDIYLDGTLGAAGHAKYALEKSGGHLTVIGLDRDPAAIERARRALGESERIILKEGNYADMDAILDGLGIGKVNRIMLDLGLSSDQFESSGKGFTFQKNEPLLMTMGNPEDYPFTAKDIVNKWQEEDIANVIFGYGEERHSRRIAKSIVNYREKKPIETSGELAEIVKSAMPYIRSGYGGRARKIHPATRTFQALRIAVNDELNNLKMGLEQGYGRLAEGGRMAVISFHSLEDRIVKHFYTSLAKEGAAVLTKKPITPSEEEIAGNPRSRSAKLRIVEKQKND